MMAIIAIVLIFLPVPVQAGEWFSWDDTNTKLHGPLTVLFAVDTLQTYKIAKMFHERGGERYISSAGHSIHVDEINPLLGEHPSGSVVLRYMATSYIAVTALVYILPDKWSYAVQAGTIGVEVWAVSSNYKSSHKYSKGNPYDRDANYVGLKYSHGF